MADIIKVSTEQLKETVTKYNNCKAQLQIAYLQMYRAVHSMDELWIGDASEAFRNQFSEMYTNLEKTEEKVQDAVDEMTQAAEIYNEIEQQNQTTFANLDTGTDPFSI